MEAVQDLSQYTRCTPGKFNPLSDEISHYILNSFKKSKDVSSHKTEESCSDLLKSFSNLSIPPKYTTLRVNICKLLMKDALTALNDHFDNQLSHDHKTVVYSHPIIPDIVIVESLGLQNVAPVIKEVIVGRQCAAAVLRGANIFSPGVLAATPSLIAGEKVAVYADLDGKCLRGSKVYQGRKMFIGNGLAEKGRLELFRDPKPNGVAVVMKEKIFDCPSLGDFRNDVFYLQNLPSVLCSHILGPEENGVVLDMCAAPGGKTTHLAAMVGEYGKVIAIDRSKRKVEQIEENARKLGLRNIYSFVYDSCKLVCENFQSGSKECERHGEGSDDSKIMWSPPYAPSSFKWILLDAPCSALGQRPQLQTNSSLKELKSFPIIQQKLLRNGVKLLKPGGILVYSTCTIVPEENEKMVSWVLDNFKNMELIGCQPMVGFPGLQNCGLDHVQCGKVLRFGCLFNEKEFAHLIHNDCDRDTIGFFIASFKKL